MSTTDISARCRCNISHGWGWDMGIGLCTWRKCQRCQGGPGMMSQEQETSPGGICPTSFSVINHGSCVTQRGLGRQMGTRDTSAETTDKSLGLAKLSSTFLSNGFKILAQPTASAAKFGFKKACYSAEVTPGPGQGHQACVSKGRTQDIGFGHIIVCQTLPTTGHHLTTAKIDRMETKSPKEAAANSNSHCH